MPGGLSAENAFPLYMKKAWKGSLCQVAGWPYMKKGRGREASARSLFGREWLLARYEDEVWNGSFCQVACRPGMSSRYT